MLFDVPISHVSLSCISFESIWIEDNLEDNISAFLSVEKFSWWVICEVEGEREGFSIILIASLFLFIIGLKSYF